MKDKSLKLLNLSPEELLVSLRSEDSWHLQRQAEVKLLSELLPADVATMSALNVNEVILPLRLKLE